MSGGVRGGRGGIDRKIIANNLTIIGNNLTIICNNLTINRKII